MVPHGTQFRPSGPRFRVARLGLDDRVPAPPTGPTAGRGLRSAKQGVGGGGNLRPRERRASPLTYRRPLVSMTLRPSLRNKAYLKEGLGQGKRGRRQVIPFCVFVT